ECPQFLDTIVIGKLRTLIGFKSGSVKVIILVFVDKLLVANSLVAVGAIFSFWQEVNKLEKIIKAIPRRIVSFFIL
ncbi:MAG: hypothetical protein P8M17_07875, partial [Saprospiraceae bacterium]|nr:hypothetical protein [Saprospiraceae bacterium]